MIKKKLISILMATAMVFAMAPLSMGAVYAEPGVDEPSSEEVLPNEVAGSEDEGVVDLEEEEPGYDKAPNTLFVEGKNAVINYSVIKKKTTSLSVSKVLVFVDEGIGDLTYAKVSGNKKITINKSSGKVTVKKKLKKGTYSVKVDVTAAGDDTHKAATQTVTFKVKITKPLKTKKILGTTCIKQGGFWFPKSLGESELSTTELQNLGQETDMLYLQRHINTFVDAVRFLKVNKCRDSEDNDTSIEHALINKASGRRAFCKSILVLVADDYSETGLFHYYNAQNQSLCLCYMKKGSYYYAADPLELLFGGQDRWISATKKGKYQNKSLSSLSNTIKKYDKRIGAITDSKQEYYPRPIDKPILSNDQIRELADNPDLTLEQASAEISTIADAINFLAARGYVVGKYSYNHHLDYDGIHWVRALSAEFTYAELAGTCGGTSNLFNRLLEGDFDEQGYVEMRSIEGGHILNYFKRGDTYYFCDFAGVSFVDDPFAYLEYETSDPQAFGEYYLAKDPRYTDEYSEYYLLNLYMYTRDGQNKAPCGRDSNSRYKPHMPLTDEYRFPDLYTNDIKGQTIILLERDGYPMRWIDAPDENLWPPEINIPVDSDWQ